MNPRQQLAGIKRTDPSAQPLADAIQEQISPAEIQARREAALRRDMRARGKSDAEIDAYLGRERAAA